MRRSVFAALPSMRITLSYNRFLVFNTIKRFRKMFAIFMIASMMSNPVAAATVETTPLVFSFAQDMRYAFYSNGWAKFFGFYLTSLTTQDKRKWDGRGAPKKDRPGKHKQESIAELETKIATIKIYPGNLEISVGEQVAFAAIGFDRDSNPISGVSAKWSALHEEKNTEISVPRGGMFSTPVAGTYTITAEIAGVKSQVKVRVIGDSLTPNIKSKSIREIDSRDFRKHKQGNESSRLAPAHNNRQSVASIGQRRNNNLSASKTGMVRTPVMYRAAGEDEYGFNSDNQGTFDNAGSERGNMPGRAIDGGAGSGNFQFAAPAVSLDGRGIDLNLAFNYNSRLWHKAGSEMTFDIDRDWLNGWNIGFGKISMQGDTFMLTDADGTRHPYKGNWYGSYPVPHTSIQTFEAHTTDGTFIDYFAESYKKEFDNSGGRNMIRAWAILPNGTRIEYGCQANYAMYPVRITDANGNYITITYLNNEGPNITTITDTLGRIITFNYDAEGSLSTITVPGLGSGVREVVRLNYKYINLLDAGSNYGFYGLTTKVRSQWVKVIRAIYYPATGTGYWFDDADSYSKYGMIRKVSERRGMTVDSNGYISAGNMSHEVKYNNPSLAGYNDWGGALTDTPTYTEMIEDWANRQTGSAPITTYNIQTSGNRRYTTITRPDGVKVVQITDNDQSSTFYGMLLEDITYDPSGNVLKRSQVNWIAGAYDSPRPEWTFVWDEKGQMRKTYYGYGSRFNAPTEVGEHNYAGQYVKRTQTEYLNSDDYVGHIANSGTMWWNDDKGSYWYGQHIFNLPRVIEVFGPVGRISYTDYEYDNKDLINNSGVPNHDLRYNPYPGNENRECRYYPVMSDPDCYCPDALSASSESVNSVAAIALAPDCDDPSGKDGYCPVNVVCKLAYDLKTKFRGLVTKTTRYADAVNLDAGTAIVENYQYDINGNLRVQSTACCEQTTFNYTNDTRFGWPQSIVRGSASDPIAQNTSSAVYDVYTGLVLESTDANGGVSTIEYDSNTLRPIREFTSTDAYVYHQYNDSGMVVYDRVYEAGKSGGDFASATDRYLDGKGQVIHEFAYAQNNGIVVTNEVRVTYDNLGRVSEQSLPWGTGSSESFKYTKTEYDYLDRPIKITSPDGSVVQRFYNESTAPSSASSNVGQTVRSRDAWGRERWGSFDENNRLIEVVEPNPSGDSSVASDGLLTQYSYDSVGNLIQTNQGGQIRRFKYDSLGRLTHQKLAERDGTLDDVGNWTGSGGWSDVFRYDNRSNLIWKKDARGVVVTFGYENDPLNRLQKVIYSKSDAPTAADIADANNVRYAYITTGDKMRVSAVYVYAGMGNQAISYDLEGRVSQVSQTFGGREAYPLVTNYLWDTLDRIKEVRYPAKYGAGDSRKVVVHNYDIASRLTELKYDGTMVASAPVFNASNQITSLAVGNQIQEKYDFDPKTGLLLSQQVVKGGEKYLDLKYNYTRDNNANNDGAKTGQLTSVTDLKNQSRNRDYVYDKLGRLVSSKGGATPTKGPDWEQVYSYDRYGNRTTNVGAQSDIVDKVWVDDSVPTGGTLFGQWNWVGSDPSPISGSVSHKSDIAVDLSSPAPYSGNVSHQTPVSAGLYQHLYDSSPNPIYLEDGSLYTHVYIDPEHVPEEIMLQWSSTTEGWNHRAYWGANRIDWGVNGATSRKYMGPLPASGGWIRLEVSAGEVGLRMKEVKGIAFTIYGGRVNWDLSGLERSYTQQTCTWVKDPDCIECPRNCVFSGGSISTSKTTTTKGNMSQMAPICPEGCEPECPLIEQCSAPVTVNENIVLVDDSIPSGATMASSDGSFNWTGERSSQMLHQHGFEWTSNRLLPVAGDVLYAWVYLDPANMPKEIMLQWYDDNGGGWEHRAYWGADKIGWGVNGTVSRKYMGALPSGGGWVKLEIPATAVGLEGKNVHGMAFTLYGGRATWDKAGMLHSKGLPVDAPVASKDGLVNLTYNSTNNRITNGNFSYDAAGNQTSAIINSLYTQNNYKYDSANRLVEVKDASGNVLSTYAYGSSNQRIMSTEGGVTTVYATEGGQVLAEYEAVGTSGLQWKMSYVYMGGRLLATEQSNGIRYHHSDRLGTRLVTDASDGAVISENLTMPFGTADPMSWQDPNRSNLSKKKFTSYDRSDATGLDYAVNRQYSAAQGRFTQVDPIGMSAVSLGDPQTLNLYAYCANDPINRLDPDGTSWFGKLFKWIGKALMIVGIAVVVAVAVFGGAFPLLSVGGFLGKVIGGIIKFGEIIGRATNFLFGGALLGETAASGAAAKLGGAILAGAGYGLGALGNYLQQQDKDKRKKGWEESFRENLAKYIKERTERKAREDKERIKKRRECEAAAHKEYKEGVKKIVEKYDGKLGPNMDDLDEAVGGGIVGGGIQAAATGGVVTAAGVGYGVAGSLTYILFRRSIKNNKPYQEDTAAVNDKYRQAIKDCAQKYPY